MVNINYTYTSCLMVFETRENIYEVYETVVLCVMFLKTSCKYILDGQVNLMYIFLTFIYF